MRTEWRDPDDITPSAARTAKTITGYRTYCPLRRYLQRHGSAGAFTERHILAADELRRLADAVVIGFGVQRDLVAIQAITYGPRSGPSVAALKQARAWPTYRRAMMPFNRVQRELIAHCLLLNWSIARWTARQRESGLLTDPKMETGKLIAVLDVLAEHFSAEIKRDLERGANV
jgi:hypothetical protein